MMRVPIMEPLIKFRLYKQHKHDDIQKITLPFEDNCFCFQVTGFFYQKKMNSYPKFL